MPATTVTPDLSGLLHSATAALRVAVLPTQARTWIPAPADTPDTAPEAVSPVEQTPETVETAVAVLNDVPDLTGLADAEATVSWDEALAAVGVTQDQVDQVDLSRYAIGADFDIEPAPVAIALPLPEDGDLLGPGEDFDIEPAPEVEELPLPEDGDLLGATDAYYATLPDFAYDHQSSTPVDDDRDTEADPAPNPYTDAVVVETAVVKPLDYADLAADLASAPVDLSDFDPAAYFNPAAAQQRPTPRYAPVEDLAPVAAPAMDEAAESPVAEEAVAPAPLSHSDIDERRHALQMLAELRSLIS